MINRVEAEACNVELSVAWECEGEFHSARIMNDRRRAAKMRC
jgi:hypothetical protein